MKNILITVAAVLITILTIVLIIRGAEFGNIQILSVIDIKEKSEQIDKDIEKLNVLKNTTYRKKISDLEKSTKTLTVNKKNYLDIASISSEEEIKEANQDKVYSMEFLWNKVGNYATKQGVNLKWDVTPTGANNKYSLSFTVTGSYIGIINYVYALENDSELAFTIENFKVVSGGSSDKNTSDAEKLNATFTVSNIGIKQESISSNLTNTNTNENQ